MTAPEAHSHPPDAESAERFWPSVLERWQKPAGVWSVTIICAIALGLRVYIAAITHGTNDIDTWKIFATLALQHGVARVYQLHPLFNHPPLMGWYGAGVLTISNALHAEFSFVFKLVPILADTISVVLVHSIGKLSPFWLLLFAINPANVLVSAFHGNTDCLCAMFCLASAYFGNRARPIAGGLSLAAALNVKLIPVMLIAPLALSFQPKRAVRFTLALGVGVIPFIPIALAAWDAFRQNALQYNSFYAPWGLGLITTALDGRLLPYQQPFADFTGMLGKPLILGGSVLLGSLQLRFQPFTRAELCGLASSWFLVCSPGFGAQYLVYPAAFLALTPGTRIGFRYIYLGGAFAFLIYYSYWTGTMPAYANFALHSYDLRTMLVGFLTWLTLVSYVSLTLGRGIQRIARSRLAG